MMGRGYAAYMDRVGKCLSQIEDVGLGVGMDSMVGGTPNRSTISVLVLHLEQRIQYQMNQYPLSLYWGTVQVMGPD